MNLALVHRARRAYDERYPNALDGGPTEAEFEELILGTLHDDPEAESALAMVVCVMEAMPEVTP